MSEAKGKLARWRLRLQEMDFEVVHRPGIVHRAADALSRLLTEGEDESPLDDEVPVLVVSPQSATRADTLILCDDEAEIEDLRKRPETNTEDEPIRRDAFLTAQHNDGECQFFASTANKPGSKFDYDEHGYLIRRSKLDESPQKVVPASLRHRVLYLAHNPILQGHPRTTKMYDSLRQSFYWPMMFADVDHYVSKCTSCARSRGTPFKHQHPLKLFPATQPLDEIAMDLIGPLPKTSNGKRHILVITDRYSKLSRAIPMAKTTAPHVAAVFMNNWVFPYGVPKSILTDNGPQFIAEFFEFVCAVIDIKRIAITAYHAQTNGQTERYNQTLERRIRHYVNEHQDDWDLYVQPLTYAYNTQVHRSTSTSPFSLVLTRHPPSTIVETVSDNPQNLNLLKSTKTVRDEIVKRMTTMFNKADRRLYMAQQSYKKNYDRNVKYTKVFQPGQYVFIDRPPNQGRTAQQKAENIAQSKLRERVIGPYKIVQVFDNVVVVEDQSFRVPISIDRCVQAPVPTPPPPNPNAQNDDSTSYQLVTDRPQDETDVGLSPTQQDDSV